VWQDFFYIFSSEHCRGSRVGCDDLDFAGGTPASAEVGPIDLNRPEGGSVNRRYLFHRGPIEVVVQHPIPAGKIGVSVNAHQFVIVPVDIGYSLSLFCQVEAM
jgi:hypothetical protein